MADESGYLEFDEVPNNCSMSILTCFLGPNEGAGTVEKEMFKKNLKEKIIQNLGGRILVTLNKGQVKFNEPLLLANYFEKIADDDKIHIYLHRAMPYMEMRRIQKEFKIEQERIAKEEAEAKLIKALAAAKNAALTKAKKAAKV